MNFRLWYLTKNTAIWLYIATFLFFLISTTSRLLFNGMILDFDYHLYQPDGAVYTYMALKFSGESHEIAANTVINWYEIYGEPGTNLNLQFFDRELNPVIWALGLPRVVYPILSIPFVLILGVPGMLVVPIIAFLLLLLMVAGMALRMRQPVVGIGLIFLLTTSSTISRWYVANITDGLLATIIAIALYVYMFYKKPYFLLLFPALIVLGSLTRFSAPYWLAFSIVFWCKSRITAIVSGVVALLGIIPLFITRPDTSYIVPGAEGLFDKILRFPSTALRVLFIEFAQLAAIDRSLLLLITSAVVLAFMNLGAESSRIYILMCLAGWFIGSLNGVLGVNFRYQLPIIIFASWVILDNLSLKWHVNRGNTQPI